MTSLKRPANKPSEEVPGYIPEVPHTKEIQGKLVTPLEPPHTSVIHMSSNHKSKAGSQFWTRHSQQQKPTNQPTNQPTNKQTKTKKTATTFSNEEISVFIFHLFTADRSIFKQALCTDLTDGRQISQITSTCLI